MRILVNAGPTREYFDSVRFISNPSTGKQGYALAAAAARRGHGVVLVSGPVSMPEPPGVRILHVTSAAEMAGACKEAFTASDAAIMTAAVCDYRPPQRLPSKLAKRMEPFAITLEPTEDICAALGRIKGTRQVMGFAMNDTAAEAAAERKLREKRCDYIVLNGIENVGADHVTVRVLSARTGWAPPMSGSKADVAEHLLDLLDGSSTVPWQSH